MCLSLRSPASPFGSITSFLAYAGADNSGLPSSSQESLPCLEADLLQAAPPRSAWIRQCFWGQQFLQAACLPFLTYLSHLLVPCLFPPFSWCPYHLVLGVPNFSYHLLCSFPPLSCGAAYGSHGDRPSHQPCDHSHGLPVPHFCMVTWEPEARWLSLLWVFGSWSTCRRLGGVACPLQCLKGVGLTARRRKAGDGFQMQGAGDPVPSCAIRTEV